MTPLKRKFVTLALVAGFVLAPFGTPALAEDVREHGPGPAAMAVDAVLVRPLSLVGAVVSTAFFVVSLPFSALGGNVGEAANNMVAEPWQFTFVRPLGQVE